MAIFLGERPEGVYGVIYVITNLVNSKQYVGQTIHSSRHRWSSHSDTNGGSRVLSRAIQKYGVESFVVETVDTADDKLTLDSKEAAWVKDLDTVSPRGYNLTTGGGSSGKPSPETVELRRAALLGHPTSQKTRDLISAAQKNRPLSPEHRAALRVPKKNRTREGIEARKAAVRKAYAEMTPERKREFGQHRVGTRHSPETLTKMREKAQARTLKKREPNGVT